MHAKIADLESTVNHMRRIMQSNIEEKTSLETKLETANKEKERQSGLVQNFKT